MSKLAYAAFILSVVVVPPTAVALYHWYNTTHTLAYGCGYVAAMRLARPDVDKAERSYCVTYRTTASQYGFNP